MHIAEKHEFHITVIRCKERCFAAKHVKLTGSTGWPKNWHSFLYALTFSDINQFSKLFHCQNQEKVYNNAITKDPTTPQVCRYTTL